MTRRHTYRTCHRQLPSDAWQLKKVHWTFLSYAWQQKAPLSQQKAGAVIMQHSSSHKMKSAYKTDRRSNMNCTFFGSHSSHVFQQVSWLTDHRFSIPSHAFLCNNGSIDSLPVYSDRIAQDFHLIPFYLRALHTLRTENTCVQLLI